MSRRNKGKPRRHGDQGAFRESRLDRAIAEVNKLCTAVERDTNLLAFDLTLWDNDDSDEYTGHPGPSDTLRLNLQMAADMLRSIMAEKN